MFCSVFVWGERVTHFQLFGASQSEVGGASGSPSPVSGTLRRLHLLWPQVRVFFCCCSSPPEDIFPLIFGESGRGKQRETSM